MAEVLERVSELLEAKDSNPFRVASYRRAADEIRATDRPLTEIYRESGARGLERIPGVGARLAGTIAEFIDSGRLGLLDRLESEVSPETLFARLPGVGRALAHRIADELGVESLEDLERAAHDGRLERVEGIGAAKAEGIRNSLAGILGRSSRRQSLQRLEHAVAPPRPPVALLLQLDETYRRKARAGQLRKIAPRRFNPRDECWLPIMHADRQGFGFTILFSNTKRAHELGKARDWVVIYYQKDHEQDQCTVVSVRRGPLQGKRVVRGREPECRVHYASGSPGPARAGLPREAAP
jgi:hypothetical protein